MKSSYSTSLSRKSSAQLHPIPGREADMKQNQAGGYSFTADKWLMLRRYLILGTEGGTYYVNESKATEENVLSLLECIKEDGIKVVDQIVDVSSNGYAPRNDPALYALAVCAHKGNQGVRKYAMSVLPKVARTGTHFLHFNAFINSMRGNGRAIRDGVSNWFSSLSDLSLSYQMAKYKQRDGWSWRDVLLLNHVNPNKFSPRYQVLFRNAAGKLTEEEKEQFLFGHVRGLYLVNKAKDVDEVIKLVEEYNLSHEMIPTQFKKDPALWKALLPYMGMEAMVRNLGNMESYKVFSEKKSLDFVVSRFTNPEFIKKSMIHPLRVAVALNAYSYGNGMRGKNEWEVNDNVVDALEKALELSFSNIIPTGKKIYFAVDVSSSMTANIAGFAGFSSASASAIIALMYAKSEQNVTIRGFCDKMKYLGISKHDTFTSAMRKVEVPFGSTDCALPMLDAISLDEDYDVFMVITDGDTWSGYVQPSVALQRYRDKVGHQVKYIELSTSPVGTSLADPRDQDSLSVVGFDTSIPQVIESFIKM